MSNFYKIFLIAIFFSSCTKELNYDLNSKESLVVSSVFTPGETAKFYIGTTSNFLENTDGFRLGSYRLTVQEVNNNKLSPPIIDTLLMQGLFDSKRYFGGAGTYKVTLSNQYGDTVHAMETIPEITWIEKLEMKYPTGLDDNNYPYGTLFITFQDDSTTKNYYEFDDIRQSEIPVTDPILLNEGNSDFQPTSYFFSDEMFNGEKVTIALHGHYNVRYKPEQEKYVLMKPYKLTLRSVSENYYNYKKYLTKHLYNQQFQGDFWQTIYMSEPQNMYSNVIGGYGIITSYAEHTMYIDYISE